MIKIIYGRESKLELGGEKVDFLFIDGDHTEAGVEADYNDYHHLSAARVGLLLSMILLKNKSLPSNSGLLIFGKDSKLT